MVTKEEDGLLTVQSGPAASLIRTLEKSGRQDAEADKLPPHACRAAQHAFDRRNCGPPRVFKSGRHRSRGAPSALGIS